MVQECKVGYNSLRVTRHQPEETREGKALWVHNNGAGIWIRDSSTVGATITWGDRMVGVKLNGIGWIISIYCPANKSERTQYKHNLETRWTGWLENHAENI